jgi:hypothetical protein
VKTMMLNFIPITVTSTGVCDGFSIIGTSKERRSLL